MQKIPHHIVFLRRSGTRALNSFHEIDRRSRNKKKLYRMTGRMKFCFVLVLSFCLALSLCPEKSVAEVPNTILIDNNNWNSAVLGRVIEYEQHEDYFEATVEVSNPHFF